MGYLSFDASVKIHMSGRYTSTKTSESGFGGINGYIRHIDRATDKKNGCEVNHSNPDIDASLTLNNESYYKDSNGVWNQTNQSKDMVDSVNRRIDFARKHKARISDKGKNDTVIVRPLIVQLDSEEIERHKDTWMWDVMTILEQDFGKENIVGFSVHRDETYVHLHILFVPCHESKNKNGDIKCTLSQTKFFKNPRQLAGIHKKMRTELCNMGYDIELENKPIEEQLAGYEDKNGVWHQQGLTTDQLKELSNRVLNLQIGELDMKLRQAEMDKLEQAMKQMQETAKSKQEELEKGQEELVSQQTVLENQKASVQAQMQAVINEKVAVEQMKKEAEEMLSQAVETATVCDQILNDEKNLNGKFLEFLDRESERTQKPFRKLVESLYKKFQKERRDNLSSWNLEMLRLREERKKNGNTNIPELNIIDVDSSLTDYGLTM